MLEQKQSERVFVSFSLLLFLDSSSACDPDSETVAEVSYVGLGTAGPTAGALLRHVDLGP